MTKYSQAWIVDNMKSVALQLYDTEGNIVMFCNNGRTRSPMYLVAYLVIFHDVFLSEAVAQIKVLLLQFRGYKLDRYDQLMPALVKICDDT